MITTSVDRVLPEAPSAERLETLTLDVVRLLALRGRGRGKLQTPTDLLRQVLGGLPVAAFDRLAGALGVPAAGLLDAIDVNRATLARRRDAGKLSTSESDALVRVARVFARAAHLFGGEAKAAAWLRRPAAGLGGKTPLEYCRTDLGAQEVERLIGRLEHGVF